MDWVLKTIIRREGSNHLERADCVTVIKLYVDKLVSSLNYTCIRLVLNDYMCRYLE